MPRQQRVFLSYAHEDLDTVQKLYDEALIVLNKALVLDPDYDTAWFNKGYTLENTQRYDEALAAYEKALAITPDYFGALVNNNIVLNKLSQKG